MNELHSNRHPQQGTASWFLWAVSFWSIELSEAANQWIAHFDHQHNKVANLFFFFLLQLISKSAKTNKWIATLNHKRHYMHWELISCSILSKQTNKSIAHNEWHRVWDCWFAKFFFPGSTLRANKKVHSQMATTY
jgi:hypothetical protein